MTAAERSAPVLPKRYRVTSGTFTMPDNSVVDVGGELDLSDEQAAVHAAQIVLVEPAMPAVHDLVG